MASPVRNLDSIPIFAAPEDRDRPETDEYGAPVAGWQDGDMSYVISTRTLEVWEDGQWNLTGVGSGGSVPIQGWPVALYSEDPAGLGSTWDGDELTWTAAPLAGLPLNVFICGIEQGDPEDVKSGIFAHEGSGVFRKVHAFSVFDATKLIIVSLPSGGSSAGLIVELFIDATGTALTRGIVYDPNA